ncbi:MAG TPA: hypothetical protein VGG10_18670 [Rhizomicrobium sp.]|jgi:hypothetical protein
MRYRGGTYEYWWSHLTLRRLYEIERDLEQHPPADWFVAGYFKYTARARHPLRSGATAEPRPPDPGLPLYDP